LKLVAHRGIEPIFLPKRFLVSGILNEVLAELPLATSAGGQFREHLEAAAGKARCPMRIELSCSSFTQAARAVKSGAFGAVLPSLAAVEFAAGEVVQFPLPFLKAYARPLCLAWNPRLTSVRPVVVRAIKAMDEVLGGKTPIVES